MFARLAWRSPPTAVGSPRKSAACELNGVPEVAQPRGDTLAVVALHLHHAVLHRAARAAEAPELRGARLECGAALGEAADHRDRLAAAAAAVAEDADHAVVGDARSARRGPGASGARHGTGPDAA